MRQQFLPWFLVLVVLILAGTGWFFLRPLATITNFPSSGTDIVAYGDSLIVGTGATSGNNFIDLLSRRIGQPIINLGVSGNTTADGLARLHTLDDLHPKVVILLLGGNDFLQQVPVETTFKNLSRIISYIQSKGAIVLLLGVQGSLLRDRLAPEFEALKDTYHTAYVSNVLDGLIGHSDYMADSIHPNDAGNKIIAERIYPVLIPLLK
jgi:acyl-CoA thioesterase-1